MRCLASRRSELAPAIEASTRDARDWLLDVALLPLDNAVLHSATELGPVALRSLDALHLATALSVRDDIGVMLTYDRRLAEAAQDRGFGWPRRGSENRRLWSSAGRTD